MIFNFYRIIKEIYIYKNEKNDVFLHIVKNNQSSTMITKIDELLQGLKKKQYAPVYLLMGEEPFFIDQISKYIEENVIDEANRDFNQAILYGKDTDSAEILANVKEFPFGSPYRVVIVKEAQDLHAMDSLKLYAEKPSENAILVLCVKYKKLRAELYKPFEKKGIVFLSEKIKDNKLPEWIVEQSKNYEFKMNLNTAKMLAEHIGNDLSLINSEFLKLRITLPAGTEITPQIIERYVGISKEYNIFELQNALGERNLPKIYKITYNFCNNIKENPNVKTIAALNKFYMRLLAYHYAPVKNEENLKKIFGNLHPFVIQLNCQYAQRYSLFELKKIIGILREFDLKSKGLNTTATDSDLLKEMIYKILH